jgi:hypothetical protein
VLLRILSDRRLVWQNGCFLAAFVRARRAGALMKELVNNGDIYCYRLVLTLQDLGRRFRIRPFRNFLVVAQVSQQKGRRACFSRVAANVSVALVELLVKLLANPSHLKAGLCLVGTF